MKEMDRNGMVERYLGGDMSAAESRDFERLSRTDEELGRLLRAEQVIRGAVRKDIAVRATAALEPSAHLLSKLSSVTPGGAPAAAGGAASGGPSIGTFFGTMSAKLTTAVVGLVGVAVGVFIVAPWLDSPETKEPVPAPTPAHSSPRGTSADRPALEAPSTTPSAEPATTPATSPGVSMGTDAAAKESGAGSSRDGGRVGPVRTSPSGASAGTRESAAASPDQGTEIEEGEPDPVIFSSDSVRVRVNLGPEKKR